MVKKEIIRFPLWHYIHLFEAMNCNKHHGRVAPHKAVMLLAVMKGVETGFVANGFVPINKKMKDLFESQWRAYVGMNAYFNAVFSTPFFHLANEPFWTLMKRDEYDEKKEYSFSSLQRNFFGAKISDDLFDYMLDTETRKQLFRALTDKFFGGSNRNTNGYVVNVPDEKGDVAAEYGEALADVAA